MWLDWSRVCMVSSKLGDSGTRNFILCFSRWVSSASKVMLLSTSLSEMMLGLLFPSSLMISLLQVILLPPSRMLIRNLLPTSDLSSYLLDIEITRNQSLCSLSLSQHQYIINALTTFSMFDCNPVSTPMDPELSLSAADGPQTDSERLKMSTIP